MRRLAALALSLSLAAGFAQSLGAQAAAERNGPGPASAYRLSVETDWDRRSMSIKIELMLRAAGLSLPSGRLEAERMVERDLPGLVKDAVFPLPVDSRRTIGDTIIEGSLDINALLGLAYSARRTEAHFTRDLSTFVARYELPLLAASALYVRHSAPTPISASMAYRPTRPYTGIVIYAREELPVHGERVTGKLQPSLFPRIYDSEMNLLMDRNALAPASLRAWGPVSFVEELDASSEDRVGDEPLRIVATELFGSNRTDIIIDRDEALKILGLPQNRRLIEEGRVIVVYSP